MGLQINFDEHIEKAQKAFRNERYYLIENAYDAGFCARIRDFIDSVEVGPGVQQFYGDTESRIWSSQKRCAEVEEFHREGNDIMSRVIGHEMRAGTVLAIKNVPLGEVAEQHTKGRWHIDSWRSQEKIFLFLSDTNEDSGPFEFIPNTHKSTFRIRKALENGFFFDFSKIFNNSSRPYQSIDDDKIEYLFSQGFKSHPVITKAGSILIVNPSYLIHRARPCVSGHRYALTSYFSVPSGFHNYDVGQEIGDKVS